jgi:clan AA aspartic protease (TIGR02281 family)
MLLTLCSAGVLSARQPDEAGKRALEREVKTSGNYLYGEALADTKDEAASEARTILASEINREAKSHSDWRIEGNIQAKDLEQYSETIDLMRGSKIRIVAYIKKDNVAALFDKMPAVESTENIPKKNVEIPQSVPATTEQPRQTIIQMEKEDNGTYSIPCKVNGMALKFTYDTGATRVVISQTEFDYMLKNDHLSESDVKESIKTSIASGEIIEGKRIILREIEINGLMLRDVEANVIPASNAPLLLGLSALSKLGKIEFDYEQGTLTIKEGLALTQAPEVVPVEEKTEKTPPAPPSKDDFFDLEVMEPVTIIPVSRNTESVQSPVLPAVTNGDLLDQIRQASSMYQVREILHSNKRKGKVAYGRTDRMLSPETKYIIVYERTGKIVALLDKSSAGSRRDLISGETFGNEILNNNQTVWIQFF